MQSQNEIKKFSVGFTKDGKRFIATVDALSQAEAFEKVRLEAGEGAIVDKIFRLYIQGTYCASCEVLIERKFNKIPGITKVNVNYRTGEAVLHIEDQVPFPNANELEAAIQDKRYHVYLWEKRKSVKTSEPKTKKGDLKELAAILLVLFGGYLLLKNFNFFPKGPAINDTLTYPLIFVIGFVAAGSSCLVVVGGLLISLSGTWSKTNEGQSSWKKFQPHLLFNTGRLVSYAFFGGVIGMLGSAITVNAQASGWLMIMAAVFMMATGLSMLNIVQRNPLLLAVPKRFQYAVHNASGSKQRRSAFLIGIATFFVPCGFTQSLQIYTVTTGSFEKGALTMFVFALGTMPALLGIGALSSFTKGAPYRYFLKFAGALVLFLAIANLNSGMTLVGINPSDFASSILKASASNSIITAKQNPSAKAEAPNIVFEDGKQIVSMKVYSNRYSPDQFTVKKGIPVQWKIEGVEVHGCTSGLIVQKYGIQKRIVQGANVVEFTPNETGTIPFSCSMGMFRGKFTVID